ncbi:Down syndrome cell adhesion molecule-like protein Dscam2 [Penaeus monodon]|uniref:Down syndrome cell adhesion molecule-like protein Dscam2 n=1 Tax=Penaeus monodon TaxID=6687 RepID=UPI0018A6EF7F|nr:Down syndrome cell adhesion molecule-like protein Dscam2 [Penaeus monodon]
MRWSSYTGGGVGNSMGVHLGGMGGLGGMRDRQSFAPSPGSAVLVIEAARASDAHAYTCTANNTLGVDQMSVEVLVESPLKVTVIPRSLTADLGGTATFSCSVSDPAATVSWYYNGSPVVGSGRVVAAGRQLIVSGVNRDDPGMYQCQAIRGTRAAQQAAQLMLGDSAPVLHYRFIEQTIQPGPPVSLKCSAGGNPTPTITWTLDGLPIPQTERVVVGEQLGTRSEVVSHVNVSHTRVEDGGRYECVATNRAGSTAHAANLNIYGFPVSRPLASVTAVSEEKLHLRCPVAGYPLHSFAWTKDGVSVDSDPGRIVQADGTLVVEHVRRPEDAGVYTCTASTKPGRSATGSVQVSVRGRPRKLRDVLELKVRRLPLGPSDPQAGAGHPLTANERDRCPSVPPKIAPFAAREWVVAGERLTLTCTVSRGDEPLSLSWLWDGAHPQRLQLRADGGAGGAAPRRGLHVRRRQRRLRGPPVLLADRSRYRPVLPLARPPSSALHLCHDRVLNLCVLSAPPTVPPRIQPFKFQEGLSEGMRTRVVCGVNQGDAPLKLEWLKDGRPLSLGGPPNVQVKVIDAFSSVLAMSSLTAAHSGRYTCEAHNAAAAVRFTASLSVHGKVVAVAHGTAQHRTIAHLTIINEKRTTQNKAFVNHQYVGSSLMLFVLKIEIHITFRRLLCEVRSPLLGLVPTRALRPPYPPKPYWCANDVVPPAVPPSWVLEPADTRVSRGHALVVDCVARGHPEPSVTWKKKVTREGQSTGSDAFRSVELVSPRAVQLSNGSLYIARAEPEHSGTYVCQAANSVTHLSTTVAIAVNSAPYFTSGMPSVDVRAGELANLECRVRGDPPLTVTWALRGASLHHSPKNPHYHPLSPSPPPSRRYEETVKVAPGGETVARLTVSSAAQADAGIYTCTAHNAYGRNSHTVRLNVHEPPSAPRGLRVVSEGSRAVRVSWAAPDPPPTSYVVQFRRALEGWGEAREVSVSGESVSAGVEVSPLLPATDYVVRLVAVNHLGRSPPSEDLRLTTSAEKPGAPPRDLRAEATGPREVRVSWRPPPRDRAYGIILGYYLGYTPVLLQSSASGSPQYNFTTVESSEGGRSGPEGEGTWSVTVSSLDPHTDYHVVVQAYNTEGAGPLSPPATVTTREDAPGGAPQEVRCTGLSWDSVQISWSPPEPHLHHGTLRGYKIEYERWDGWSEAIKKSQTTAQTAVLTGLEAATNYSVRVRTFTGAGEGPWAAPALCTTDEDLPGRPGSVRGVVSGPGAFIVSWAPPIRPGGRIVSYTVTWRVVGARMGGGHGREGIITVAGSVTWVQVDNVLGSLVEVEVVASTRVGEGPPGATRVTITNTVPAAIYSHSASIRAERGRDVTLPCGHVGQPRPHLVWKYQGRPVGSEGRMVKGDGGLVVQEAQRLDSGNYTCTVTNEHGTDHITYSLTVLGRLLWLCGRWVEEGRRLKARSSSVSERASSIEAGTGGAPITGYTLYYRKDHGAWTQVHVNRHSSSYTLTGLECGSRYHVYAVAHNAVGSSTASTMAVVRTMGGVPQPPPSVQFFTPNSSSVTVYPRAWVARGCPITHMVLEYRQKDDEHWVQVSSGGPQDSRVEIGGLMPSTAYSLRVTAVASAGSKSHTYTFTTLTAAGELPPAWVGRASPQWLSVRVLLPLLTSVVALASSLALVCYCVRRTSMSPWRRPNPPPSVAHFPETSPVGGGDGDGDGDSEGTGRGANTAARDNKHNLAQREQYYATIRKAPTRDQQPDRVPENAEDIYPYATFQLPDPAPPDPNHIPMYPIYQKPRKRKGIHGNKILRT